jgi:predicted metal-dependent phosphotriesterase family hydrolase
MEFDKRQEIRVNRTMKKFFLDLGEENTSEYIRSLVEKDILEKCDPDFIKNQIKTKKEEIQHLEELLSAPHPLMGKANDFFAKHAKSYKANALVRTPEQRYRFIKDVILPEIKKYGVNKSVEEIDQILMNYPDEHNGGDIV